MPEFLREMTLENLIVIGTVIIIFILNIWILIKQRKTLIIIGNRSVNLKTSVILESEMKLAEITVFNRGFTNVAIRSLGIVYRGKQLPLYNEERMIHARNSFKVTTEISEFINLLKAHNDGKKKIGKILAYTEDTVAQTTKFRDRRIRIEIKKLLKADLKARKQRAKSIREQTGNYNFGERLGKILLIFVTPITWTYVKLTGKVNQWLKRASENKREKERERLEEKKICDELKLYEEEQRTVREQNAYNEKLKKEKENVDAKITAEPVEDAKQQVSEGNEYQKMTVAELKEIAKSAQIKGASSMKKTELIEALKNQPKTEDLK